MFKNAVIYRLPAPWAMTAAQLEKLLAPQVFTFCGSLEAHSSGWLSPRNNGALVHTVNQQMLLKLGTEKKLLPSSVINDVTKARAAEVEQQQGFAPGRKQLRELKEDVTDELLPRAFPLHTATWAWIDPVHGWLVVDASSTGRAEEVLKLLIKAIDKFPLESLRTAMSPVTAMTGWLLSCEAPRGFTVDQDTELRSTGEGKATVRYIRHTLEVDDTRRHIEAGKQCTRLAMTWESKISFVLTEGLTIKRIVALDVLKQDADVKNDDERFDSEFALMAGELNHLFLALVDALGGQLLDGGETNEVAEAASGLSALLREDGATATLSDSEGNVLATFDGKDDLYDQAVVIVRSTGRGSISLVQRNLRIGYNHAARLLEQMEVAGIVSAMQGDGTRKVLAAL